MTITEVQQETGWGKRGDTWVPPSPLQRHGHERDDIRLDGIWDPGDVKWSARTTAAPGWLLADGSAVSRSVYARLFEAIGVSYGAGDGTTTFNLPNAKGRMFVGKDATDAAFDILGETGGSKTSTAPHSHQYGHTHGTDSSNNQHAHNVYTRNQDTGTVSSWHTHNYDHWHLAVTSSLLWNGTQTHGHHDRGGAAAEGPWEGANWTGGTSVNVTGTGGGGTGTDSANHVHNFNHDHPSTNYNTESPWAGNYNHSHQTTSQSTSTSGDSSVTAANGNLPPYLVFNCFVKL